MNARSAATLGLGLLVAIPTVYVLATVITTVWYWKVYVPRIAGPED